ncbi:diguanylate cyclase [Shewanella corallii]|uniref:diguanylate cyclase n=1 Tax=Shewanella corallii TaxID=560080 RepID=A0ABT0N266_9GAMM|nr:diguanylate cyclase [Shewanella corallii]MCL2912220.1 diguanylate cyclase [Shewanella corallii]
MSVLTAKYNKITSANVTPFHPRLNHLRVGPDPLQNELTQLLGQMQDAKVLVDGKGKVLSINLAAAMLLGDTCESFLDEHWQSWLTTPFKSEYEFMLVRREGMLMPLQHGPREVVINQACGGVLPVHLSVSSIGELFVLSLQDLSDLKAELARMSELAAKDPLTSLYNRRAFDEALQRHWDSCKEDKLPLCTVIIDVDYFKSFNDMHGHIQGDKCLKRIARVIRGELPNKQSMAARYGGEEFALILPGCAEWQAQEVAERIRARVRSLEFGMYGLPEETMVSVSQGIASEEGENFPSPVAMLCCADTALYRSKKEGRDRITSCSC